MKNSNQKIEKLSPNSPDYPKLLKENFTKNIYVLGRLPHPEKYTYITFVGSRKNSDYGKAVCQKIINELKGTNAMIVSGLAYGIDKISHAAALEVGLKTIAIPGSGLEWSVLYPSAHRGLAEEILQKGGALVSMFEPTQKADKWTFPQRNALMAGISAATIVIEAEKKSGTLITAKYAVEFNRDLFVVPHDIFRKTGEGPNMFLKLGAYPITSGKDLIEHLELEKEKGEKDNFELSEKETHIKELLEKTNDKNKLLSLSKLSPQETLQTLMELQIKGFIKEELGKIFWIK